MHRGYIEEKENDYKSQRTWTADVRWHLLDTAEKVRTTNLQQYCFLNMTSK